MKSLLILIVSLLLLHLSAYAQSSCLDSSFADNGVKNNWDLGAARRPFLMDDGNILYTEMVVDWSSIGKIKFKKLLTNGMADNSFGEDGVLEYPITGYYVYNFHQLPDKSLLLKLHKSMDTAVGKFLKLNPDLSIDSTYGDNGIARTKRLVDSAGVKVWQEWGKELSGYGHYPDGKTLLAYVHRDAHTILLMRFTASGYIDTTFGDNGSIIHNIGAFADIRSGFKIMNDGRAVICGRSYDSSGMPALMLMCILPNGSLDSSFHHTGMLHTRFGLFYYPYINDMCLQPDNKIVVTGNIGPPFVARFNVDGSPDSTFNGMGYKALQDSLLPNHILLQGEKIIVSARIGEIGHTHSGITRLMADGNIDSSFCEDGLFKYKPDYEFKEVGISEILSNNIYIYM